jgi:hypothetical protein
MNADGSLVTQITRAHPGEQSLAGARDLQDPAWDCRR